MIKSEPKSILQFLATHFDLLSELYEMQVKEGIILSSQFALAMKAYGSDLEEQLRNHKILISQEEDYHINEPYFVLLEFILQKFKPLLPEEIEMYGHSIRELFFKIKTGVQGEKNILLNMMDALSKKIKEFSNAVTNNTFSLLNESRALKANTQNFDYEEKVRQARFWIDHYIAPLNTILNVHHSQSIFNELLTISKFANQRRMDYSDEGIRRQFERLYNLLKKTIQDISIQSGILTNELLPLIERIKTESEILKGIFYYLTNGNCYKQIKPPQLFSANRNNPYQQFVYENTKEYFDQFKKEEAIIIHEEESQNTEWIFDKIKYKSSLESELPVSNFFIWCKNNLEEEKEDFTLDDYFLVTSLLFEKEYEVEIIAENQLTHVTTEQGTLLLPQLKISKNEK